MTSTNCFSQDFRLEVDAEIKSYADQVCHVRAAGRSIDAHKFGQTNFKAEHVDTVRKCLEQHTSIPGATCLKDRISWQEHTYMVVL